MLGLRVMISAVALLSQTGSAGNWLLQCSTCVDQTYFSDPKLKHDIYPADTSELLLKIKQIHVQRYTHGESELFNKYFNRTQLGVMADELRAILPEAVTTIPERRYTDPTGASKVHKEVAMVRDAPLLMTSLGALNHLAHDFDIQGEVIASHGKSLGFIKEEQELNKKKREDIMEQLLKTIATTEVLARALQTTELRFSEVETGFALLKNDQIRDLEEVRDRMNELEEGIKQMKLVLEKEATIDLVEKRKRSENDLEKTKVLKDIEQMRYEEEQKTILLKNKEKKETEAQIMAMHKDKIEYETLKKQESDLTLLKATEESNLRQHDEKAKHEHKLKLLEVEQEKFKAEMKLKEEIEKARVETESRIKEVRENEDIHAREQKMALEAKKQEVLAAIHATAKIVVSTIQALYSSSQNMAMAIGSVAAVLACMYFTREMAILLREQLNKRLGRPSLVRKTSRRTRMGDLWNLIKYVIHLRFVRDTPPNEFSDVVLHKRLEDQIMRLANATKNAKARKMPLLHIMFYGPPGTGKTMCAQRFAEYSGLEYAFMSGADVAPLEEQAVTELHKLFTWVSKSRKGVLLFIDEADAFLAVRNKAMSESLRNALTTMLYHTGTPTTQFTMVLATNRPGDLDPAVLDRIDESVEFGLPDLAERERMVTQYFDMYVTKPLHIELVENDKDRKVDPVQEKPDILKKFMDGASSAFQQATGNKPATASTASTPSTRPSSLSPPQKVTPRQKALMGKLTVDTPGTNDTTSGPEGDVDRATLKDVARQLKTFSGREIAKLFTGLQTHICAHIEGAASWRTLKKLKLTKKTILEVVKSKVEEHNRTQEVLAKGYNYVHNELGTPTSIPGTPNRGNGTTAPMQYSPTGRSSSGKQQHMLEQQLSMARHAVGEPSINISINNNNMAGAASGFDSKQQGFESGKTTASSGRDATSSSSSADGGVPKAKSRALENVTPPPERTLSTNTTPTRSEKSFSADGDNKSRLRSLIERKPGLPTTISAARTTVSGSNVVRSTLKGRTSQVERIVPNSDDNWFKK